MSIASEIMSVGGYKIIDQFLTPDKWVRPETKINPIGGVLHWTANLSSGADDRANRNFFENRVNSYGSAHTIGDMDSIIAALPYLPSVAEMGYHVGADKYYTNRLGTYPNSTTLGHEMCVNKGANFRESYKRAVWVMSYWSKLYNWNPRIDVYRHYDVTRKDCPLPMTNLIYDDKHCKSKGWSDSDIKWMRDNLHVDGIQGEALWKKYIEDVEELLLYMKGEKKVTTKYNPQIVKERIYEKNGKLERCDGNYNIKATDVRWIKFDKKKIKMKFVYEKGAKVSELVKKHKADFGFNAPFFDMSNGTLYGDVIIDGKKYPNAGGYGRMAKWHEFGYRNGNIEMGIRLDINEKWDWLCQAALGLVSSGNLVYEYYRQVQEVSADVCNQADTIRRQRTIVGLDKDGNFILAVSDWDKDKKWDQGLNMRESALFMQAKGADIALWLDGGGSSVIADKTGSLGVNKGANERITHHAVLIYLVDEEDGQPTNTDKQLYRVQVGAFSNKENAERLEQELKKQGYPTIIK